MMQLYVPSAGGPDKITGFCAKSFVTAVVPLSVTSTGEEQSAFWLMYMAYNPMFTCAGSPTTVITAAEGCKIDARTRRFPETGGAADDPLTVSEAWGLVASEQAARAQTVATAAKPIVERDKRIISGGLQRGMDRPGEASQVSVFPRGS
jgi:hypothetical protein